MQNLLKSYLEPMVQANIDYLVLGCSHYPYLIPILNKLLPNQVRIIDSGEAVARQTKAILEQNNLLNCENLYPKIDFFTNGQPEVMNQLLEKDYSICHLDF